MTTELHYQMSWIGQLKPHIFLGDFIQRYEDKMTCTEIQLAGLSADKILDLAIGMSGAFKDATGTQIDNTIHAGLVALRKDEAFMQLLRGYLGPTTQAAAPQALDLATIMAIIAAIRQLIDLFGKLKGGGSTSSSYTPNDVARC